MGAFSSYGSSHSSHHPRSGSLHRVILFRYVAPQYMPSHRPPLFRSLVAPSIRSSTLQMTTWGNRFQRGPWTSVQGGHWNISGDVGLVSAGRIDKDTPPLTTPGHTSRSSTMDISSYIFQIEIHGGLDVRFHAPSDPRPL